MPPCFCYNEYIADSGYDRLKVNTYNEVFKIDDSAIIGTIKDAIILLLVKCCNFKKVKLPWVPLVGAPPCG